MKIRLDGEGLLFCTLKPNRGNSWLYIFQLSIHYTDTYINIGVL